MRYISRRSRDLCFRLAADFVVRTGSQVLLFIASWVRFGCFHNLVCCIRLYTRPSTSAAHHNLQGIKNMETCRDLGLGKTPSTRDTGFRTS